MLVSENVTGKKELINAFEDAIRKGKGNSEHLGTEEITAMEFAGGWVYAYGENALNMFLSSSCASLLDESYVNEVSTFLTAS